MIFTWLVSYFSTANELHIHFIWIIRCILYFHSIHEFKHTKNGNEKLKKDSIHPCSIEMNGAYQTYIQIFINRWILTSNGITLSKSSKRILYSILARNTKNASHDWVEILSIIFQSGATDAKGDFSSSLYTAVSLFLHLLPKCNFLVKNRNLTLVITLFVKSENFNVTSSWSTQFQWRKNFKKNLEQISLAKRIAALKRVRQTAWNV